jgi:YrhK-like protein
MIEHDPVLPVLRAASMHYGQISAPETTKTGRVGYLKLHDGWTRLGQEGLGWFVTRERLVDTNGLEVEWESRWHRKHPWSGSEGTTWWAPRALPWWIGVLFAIGSFCFALGAFPSYAIAVGTNADNLTYFIGSIFFTTAAFMQYFEAATTPKQLEGSRRRSFRQLFEVQHHRIDWWASLIQFAGTLWFNRTTFSALVVSNGASSAHHQVWRPDALGSVCFLVSSWLAWAEECHRAFAWRPKDLSWRITALNLVGSIAFGVSAIASYVKPNGQLVSLSLTNLGTFVGAICFLIGALLLLPERTATKGV